MTMGGHIKPYQIFWLLAVLLVLYTVIIPPVFGLGGGSEQYETLTHVGLFTPDGADASAISGVYGIMDGDGARGLYEWFLSALAQIGKLFSAFPVQLLGSVYAAIFLGSLYVILKQLQYTGLWVNLAVGALFVIVFCDLGYLAYLNSFYRDALSFVLLFALAASVLSMRHEMKWWKLALYTLLAVAFVFTRKLNFLAGLGLAFTAVWTVRLPQMGRLKAACWVCAVAIAVSCVFSLFATPVPAEQEGKFHAVFYGALKGSKDLEADAQALGASPALAGKTYYETDGADRSAADGVTYGDIAIFYLTHPSALLRELNIAADNSYFLTQGYLDYGGGGWKGQMALKVWSFLKRTVLPKGLWMILLFCAAYIAMCVVNVRKYRAAGDGKNVFLAGVLAILPVAALIELVGTVILTGEAAISRNLFCFGIYFDLMLVSAVIWAVHTVLNRRHEIKAKYGVNQ